MNVPDRRAATRARPFDELTDWLRDPTLPGPVLRVGGVLLECGPEVVPPPLDCKPEPVRLTLIPGGRDADR